MGWVEEPRGSSTEAALPPAPQSSGLPETPSLDLPSWAELPAPRRRRLIAVLGDLVLRARSEEARDDADRQGGTNVPDAAK